MIIIIMMIEKLLQKRTEINVFIQTRIESGFH